MAEDEADRVRALGEILREFDLDAIRLRVGETEYELVRRDPAAAPVIYAAPSGAPAVPVPPDAAFAGVTAASLQAQQQQQGQQGQ